eukprot:TRINITY_DN27840_c0_g2_i1.p1 TRINITY_DN27840_c0_g2~~TRINITY_DN27840_c0_g2_i1.p1  ORF type:complete len:398 (+),score=36.15 TRINITY_DN27840_c0_g2_i1:71-1195(+)
MDPKVSENTADDTLNLTIADVSGESLCTVVAHGNEKVQDLIARMGQPEESDPSENVVLLSGGNILPASHSLRDCGVSSGAALTLVYERTSQLQMVSFAYGHHQDPSAFSWADEAASPAVLAFCSGAAAWCHHFADGCLMGACAAVCSLQNPEQLQQRVDNGEITKLDAMKAVLSCFISSLLAVGRIAAGDSNNNARAVEVLQQFLPQVACGAHLLSDETPKPEEQLSKMVEAYLKTEGAASVGVDRPSADLVDEGLAQGFELVEGDELALLNIWSDEDDAMVDWPRYLQQYNRSCACSGTDNLCNDCCKEDWLGFLRTVIGKRSVRFRVENEDDLFAWTCCQIYTFAAGIYVEDEDQTPNLLPTHYVFQWACTD